MCVSNFSGDVQTSNQVQINVTAPAGIEGFTIGGNVRYANGMLNVVTPIQNYNVQIFDINGQLIISEQNLKSFDFAGNTPGIYFVSFYYNGERKTLKIGHMN
ncbi:MAG: T9SS type A sorting domain-containing protein [Crocinitomicaceae bacterium]|nr:T9SS type A sorting domain-containing protein [Crocinitomicaceae bacterium]